MLALKFYLTIMNPKRKNQYYRHELNQVAKRVNNWIYFGAAYWLRGLSRLIEPILTCNWSKV